MKIENLLLGVILFSLVSVFGIFIVGDINNNYDKTLSTGGLDDSYDEIDRIYDLSQGMTDHTLEGEIDDTDSWESMSKGSYSAVRQTKDSINLSKNLMTKIADEMGIPSWFVVFGITALTIMLIMAIIYLIMRIGQ